MPIEICVMLTSFLAGASLIITIAWLLIGHEYSLSEKYFWINALIFSLPMLTLLYPITAKQMLTRESYEAQYTVYKYEDMPAIVVDNNIILISGKYNKNWNDDTVTVTHYEAAYSLGLYFNEYWELNDKNE